MAKRIMAVDDSKTMRDMVGFTLRKAGFDVVEAEDGQRDADATGPPGAAQLLFLEGTAKLRLILDHRVGSGPDGLTG